MGKQLVNVNSILTAVVLLLSSGPSLGGNGERALQNYTLARAPQLTARTFVEAWGPFIQRLTQETEISITLQVFDSRERFEADLFAGLPDFAFGNPYHSILAHERLGYVAMVRDDSQPLVGIIVVREDSPIGTIQQLMDKTIAFPDSHAMAASLYTRALLTEAHHLTFEPVYVGTHENVYRSVYLGKADAGGGVRQTLNSEPLELRQQLRVVFETPGVPPHPLIAHPRVSPEVREKITRAILAMSGDVEGQKLLDAVQLSKPVPADLQRDYSAILQLGLEKYTVNMHDVGAAASSAR